MPTVILFHTEMGLIRLARIQQLMRRGLVSKYTLADDFNISLRHASNHLTTLHDMGKIHIGGWIERSASIGPVPEYAWGEGEDVPPPPTNKITRQRKTPEALAAKQEAAAQLEQERVIEERCAKEQAQRKREYEKRNAARRNATAAKAPARAQAREQARRERLMEKIRGGMKPYDDETDELARLVKLEAVQQTIDQHRGAQRANPFAALFGAAV